MVLVLTYFSLIFLVYIQCGPWPVAALAQTAERPVVYFQYGPWPLAPGPWPAAAAAGPQTAERPVVWKKGSVLLVVTPESCVAL